MQLASLKSNMAKKELRVTCMVLTMTISFLVAWSPYAICAILVLAGQTDLLISNPAVIVPLIAAKTSTFTNPAIYILMNDQVRHNHMLLRVQGCTVHVYSVQVYKCVQ